ncbi:YggS family pyridoxal phosphate-dependent enzyme [Candidatus Azobacteroides pseudotrichonymphae]|uniref:Pyridoxal phosphate homeostasis protein n=1 Tax=Azobacteroides pseudotrichonymphae genomovar. CFP2 TaxID=511995 RepID=B6YS38_AZOPC|nr:YggS family pyridoxal phosphate-dependent enzyme [Candidatus Azobacteroides pseudotrichonymphae]BAG84010.1 conserved hypothetical protein [Candidatus Azobacteroides pseudotrichonymphae genomovar. CFP2]
MNVIDRLNYIRKHLKEGVRLVAVSKFQNSESILEVYNAGQRLFGENKVKELYHKYQQLPKDIEWHFIGHLQTNKLNYVVPFVDTIHSIDSFRLLNKTNYCALKYNRRIKVLLQMHIAKEVNKFGFSFGEVENLLSDKLWKTFKNVDIIGLMGMASFTENQDQITKEFSSLSNFFLKLKNQYFFDKKNFKELSMGMSGDYLLAIKQGSTMVRIGSSIFGKKTKNNEINSEIEREI